MSTAAPTVPALLKALRQASTAAAVSSATEQIFDRLISTALLKEAQDLVFGLQQYRYSGILYQPLHQATAICTEPAHKAEYLGFVLLQESVHQDQTLPVATLRQTLLQVLHANRGVLPGYVAALRAVDGRCWSSVVDQESAARTLAIVSPALKSVLMDLLQPEEHKAAVLDVLTRMAWPFHGQVDTPFHTIRTRIVHLLVTTLELVPYAQLVQSACLVHVTFLVELLLSGPCVHSQEHVALATRTARVLLEATQCLMEQNVGVVALLQSLEQLARAMPEAVTSSVFLTSAAYFLITTCKTRLEQGVMLRVLQYALEQERGVADRVGRRTVYVEILLLPLSAMRSVHGKVVADLLKMVTKIMSMNSYDHENEIKSGTPLTETATHACLAVHMIGDEKRCQLWLSSLFLSKGAMSRNSMDTWLALLLAALLSDGRPALRSAAAESLERQVNNSSKLWNIDATKALVASLVFLVSQQPSGNANAASGRLFGQWMTSWLYSLAALAATTTETMRIVLCLIDSMNGMANLRPMALKLMYEVWRNESRAFPRLETMLLEPTSPDEDIERHVVRMASIRTLCEKDPELGVQFISCIQGFLDDKLESVVSMAMDAITALCSGGCLDFYVAFKIIAQKLRKNKVTHADRPLFQERLCYFYALGGIDSTENEKHALKLLNQVWEFADSEHSNVRKSAYDALCKFPLEILGLCMPVDEIAGQKNEDENGMAVEDVEEQLDDLMERLQNEHDSNVRVEIEKLVARIIEHESAKLTVGVGRGQRMVSAASGVQRPQQQTFPQSRSASVVSAAATKEMKALFPSRSEEESLSTSSTTDWSGYLLAYQPKALIDRKNVKRKDKLVRLATQNVDELVGTVSIVLQSMELPWASLGVSAHDNGNYRVFLLIQALMEGWRGFMETYISSLDELAMLKTPVGVDDADVAFRVFSEGVTSLFHLLLDGTSNKVGGALAAGALAGKLCESRHWYNFDLRLKYEEIVEKLLLQLALSIEQVRVFSAYNSDARVSSIGFSIALQLSFGQRKSERCSNFCIQLEKIEKMFMELYHNEMDDLLNSCALLGLSHIAFLYANGYELETFEVTQWRCQRVKPLAEHVLESFLRTNHAKQPTKSSLSHGDVAFPLSAVTTEEDTSIDTVSSEFEQAVSSGGILLRWASLMGLSRISSGFSSIKRLDWLMNVRRVLTAVWKDGGQANITAIALGPVLLQCVQFNLAQSSSLETFVTTCNHRAAESAADSLDSGFLMMAAANMLCRLGSFGGFPSTIQNQTNLTVKHIKKTFENESAPDQAVHALMLSGIANFFHLSVGISGPFVAGNLSVGASVELTLDFDIIASLVNLAREFTKTERHCAFANAMLGALARAADGFYVTHKKKLFDAEIRTLPSNGLLMKTLEWLWQAHPSDNNSSHEALMSRSIPEARIAISLLGCLTSTGTVLPLLDYASLIHRVMLRLCSVDVSVACVRFSATQGNCDELLAGELLSSKRFGNADAALQAELITWLSLAATRVPTDVLETLLITTFDILKDIWRRDTASSRSVLLFDSWTAMLRDILHGQTSHRIPEKSLEMVNKTVLEKVVAELPFDVHASHFVEQFATRVLSKLDYGRRSPVDTFLKPNVVHSSVWSWWRSGIFVVELANLNVFAVTKREASLIFQWILRHDYNEWADDNLVDIYLQPLTARAGALVAQHTKPSENVSSLLDVVDAFSRGMASLGSFVHSDTDLHKSCVSRVQAIKCRALFAVMACVMTWNVTLSHENYLLTMSRSEMVDVDPAFDLLPFGLIACARGATKVSVLSERLLALLYELIRLNEDEAVRYTSILELCSRQMYLAADSCHVPSTMSREVRDFWSLRDETN